METALRQSPASSFALFFCHQIPAGKFQLCLVLGTHPGAEACEMHREKEVPSGSGASRDPTMLANRLPDSRNIRTTFNTSPIAPAMSEAEATSSRQTRQRSRIACEPCRERKRKCDGEDPCGLCRNYGYECLYRTFPRKRRRESRSTLSSQRYSISSQDNPIALPDPDSAPTLASTPFVQSLVSQLWSMIMHFSLDIENL